MMKATYKDENGIAIDLPKQTVEMYEIRERIKANPSGIDSFRLRYRFLEMALPREYMADYLQGATFEDCDVTSLGVCYSTVCNAYDYPEIKAKMAAMRGIMDDMRPAVEMAKTVNDAAATGRASGANTPNIARYGN